MDTQGLEPVEPDIDALLRRNRPEPDAAWVRVTGERLFPARKARVPALALGGAFAAAVALVATVLALAGVGPLGGGTGPVEAKDDCRTVTVNRMQRVPSIVDSRSGAPRVVMTRKPVRITERRCG
jgi:hypothetical protein